MKKSSNEKKDKKSSITTPIVLEHGEYRNVGIKLGVPCKSYGLFDKESGEMYTMVTINNGESWESYITKEILGAGCGDTEWESITDVIDCVFGAEQIVE
jgi:hypothetical protein